jgi:hypothetical protein
MAGDDWRISGEETLPNSVQAPYAVLWLADGTASICRFDPADTRSTHAGAIGYGDSRWGYLCSIP